MSGTAIFNRFAEFPKNHEAITTSNTVNLPRQMLIMAGSDGVIAAVDWKDTVVNYTVTNGTILPLIAKRINATGTTVSSVIGLY